MADTIYLDRPKRKRATYIHIYCPDCSITREWRLTPALRNILEEDKKKHGGIRFKRAGPLIPKEVVDVKGYEKD